MSTRKNWFRRLRAQRALAMRISSTRTGNSGLGRNRRLLVERLDERRVLAAITGEVFEDLDHSFRRELGEPALAGRVLFLDSNDNATLDVGELVALTDETGRFSFPELADGTYVVRLFNGTSTQQQTFPRQSEVLGVGLEVVGGNEVLATGEGTLVVTGDSIFAGDVRTGLATQIPVADQVSAVAVLPDGNLIAIGSEAGTPGVWLVNPATGSAQATQFLSGSEVLDDLGTQWSQIVLDQAGRGFLLGQSSSDAILRSIDASDLSIGIQVTEVSSIPIETQLASSPIGPRSVVAWSGEDGLEVSLWSNGGTQIGEQTVLISGAAELLDFDDAHGLLAIRSGDGDVTIHDVDGNFATLHTFTNLGETISLDGARELLLALSPLEAILRVMDLRDGSVLDELTVDLSAIGHLASMTFAGDSDSLLILGSAGVIELSLAKPGAHRVQIAGGEPPAPLQFGLRLTGDNQPPSYSTVPSFSVAEDAILEVAAPAALSTAADADGDSFILLSAGSAVHGTAEVTLNGGLRYQGNQDFFGTDHVPVILHDGRDASTVQLIELTVEPVPDPPTVVLPPIELPENALPGFVLGPLIILDPDGFNDHTVLIDDDRFVLIEGQLVFAGGNLNHEVEPQVEIRLQIFDEEFSAEPVEQIITVTIGDVNEPITDIFDIFGETSVEENIEGAFVSTFDVEDEDENDTYTLTISDSRFVFRGFDLYLADGVALDYEEQAVIPVEITAIDSGGHSLTLEFFIIVLDVAEQAGTIELGGNSVVELVLGDVVGPVIVDGFPVGRGYQVSVNDHRFEVVDSILKLVDNRSVELSTQSEIQLTITVQDADFEFDPVDETFIIEVLANRNPYHNDDLPYDVNRSGHVTAADALAIINYLNQHGPGPVGSGDPAYGYDVNNDGFVTALDALLVLNYLNLLGNGGTVGGEGGEGEQEEEPGNLADNQVDPGLPVGQSAPESGEAATLSQRRLNVMPTIPSDHTDLASTAIPEQRSSGLPADESLLPAQQRRRAMADRLSQHPQVDASSFPAAGDEEDADSYARQVDDAMRLLSDPNA